MNIEKIGNNLTNRIINAPFIPFKTGNLKYNGIYGHLASPTIYQINFNGTLVPYLDYLEQGTLPHDIPNAFGFGPNFGIGGRFDGKFHPGSTKHMYFIEIKSVNIVLNYFKRYYKSNVIGEFVSPMDR